MEKKTNARAKNAQDAASAGIDLDSLSRLMQLMSENAITEVEYDDGKLAVRLSKTAGAAPVVAAQQAAVPAPVAAAPAAAQAAPAAAAPIAPAADENRLEIPSPMVGTFYASPSPDSDPYITIGSQVSEDTVVCLVEAMKVFNEIKAGVSGKVTKILVKNEDPVEFGQPMFLVEPL